MARIILVLIISFIALTASSQTDTDSLKQENGIVYPIINKVTASETILVCQVLRLTNQNKEKYFMVVFCETPIKDSKQRAKLRSDYMLKRERIYLANVFFATVDVVEEQKIQTDTKTYFRLLEDKYDGIRLWAILNTDLFLR